MRYPLLLAVIVSFVDAAAVPADEGLFSEVAMESVFEKSVASIEKVASVNSTEQLDRITGISSLILALKAAGQEPQEKNGRVTFDLAHNGWRFPVSIGVQVDQDRIDCEMSLIKIGDDHSATTQKLLSLLASGDTRGTSFAYDRSRKLILLKISLSNRSITANQLKADLVHLATVAEKRSDVWMSLKGQPKEDLPTTESPQQKLSLVGRWSASLNSGEVFAIQIASDSNFQLVHLKSGKSTVSKGKATRSGDQLKLVGKDVTLNCKVTQTTADAFQLAINDAKGNVAVKLDFKRAK